MDLREHPSVGREIVSVRGRWITTEVANRMGSAMDGIRVYDTDTIASTSSSSSSLPEDEVMLSLAALSSLLTRMLETHRKALIHRFSCKLLNDYVQRLWPLLGELVVADPAAIARHTCELACLQAAIHSAMVLVEGCTHLHLVWRLVKDREAFPEFKATSRSIDRALSRSGSLLALQSVSESTRQGIKNLRRALRIVRYGLDEMDRRLLEDHAETPRPQSSRRMTRERNGGIKNSRSIRRDDDEVPDSGRSRLRGNDGAAALVNDVAAGSVNDVAADSFNDVAAGSVNDVAAGSLGMDVGEGGGVIGDEDGDDEGEEEQAREGDSDGEEIIWGEAEEFVSWLMGFLARMERMNSDFAGVMDWTEEEQALNLATADARLSGRITDAETMEKIVRAIANVRESHAREELRRSRSTDFVSLTSNGLYSVDFIPNTPSATSPIQGISAISTFSTGSSRRSNTSNSSDEGVEDDEEDDGVEEEEGDENPTIDHSGFLIGQDDEEVEAQLSQDGTVSPGAPLTTKAADCEDQNWNLDFLPPPPKEYLCPITLELMRDPVVLETGISYDRRAIEEHFRYGYRTCPVTNLTLSSCKLFPNFGLRTVIHNWHAAESQHGNSSSSPCLPPPVSSPRTILSAPSPPPPPLPCIASPPTPPRCTLPPESASYLSTRAPNTRRRPIDGCPFPSLSSPFPSSSPFVSSPFPSSQLIINAGVDSQSLVSPSTVAPSQMENYLLVSETSSRPSNNDGSTICHHCHQRSLDSLTSTSAPTVEDRSTSLTAMEGTHQSSSGRTRSSSSYRLQAWQLRPGSLIAPNAWTINRSEDDEEEEEDRAREIRADRIDRVATAVAAAGSGRTTTTTTGPAMAETVGSSPCPSEGDQSSMKVPLVTYWRRLQRRVWRNHVSDAVHVSSVGRTEPSSSSHGGHLGEASAAAGGADRSRRSSSPYQFDRQQDRQYGNRDRNRESQHRSVSDDGSDDELVDVDHHRAVRGEVGRRWGRSSSSATSFESSRASIPVRAVDSRAVGGGGLEQHQRGGKQNFRTCRQYHDRMIHRAATSASGASENTSEEGARTRHRLDRAQPLVSSASGSSSVSSIGSEKKGVGLSGSRSGRDRGRHRTTSATLYSFLFLGGRYHEEDERRSEADVCR